MKETYKAHDARQRARVAAGLSRPRRDDTGEATAVNPAPLDPAASRVEGAGAPGTDANTGSDLAASVVADGVNAVPGVTSARRVLRAGLEGEALQMAVRFDRELAWQSGLNSWSGAADRDSFQLARRG